MKSLVWFRRDLRLADNPALYHAARQSSAGLIGLFLISPQQWKEHGDANCKVKFWLENVRLLSESLAKRGIPLLAIRCDSFAQAPREIVSIVKKHGCTNLFFNREYEFNEARRDEDVAAACAASNIQVQQFHDRVIVPPRAIATKEGRFYSVFTPYRRRWDAKALESFEVLPRPHKQPEIDVQSSLIPTKINGFDLSPNTNVLWRAGESEAQRRLTGFAKKMAAYGDGRDIPSIRGTSLLSPYLAAGVISPRQCLAMAVTQNSGTIHCQDGPTTWISELTWRDFYIHVMVGFPRVAMHQPFKLQTESLAWRTCEVDLNAWQQGRTGYPIVDAGMRQLNQTGWMHNRLRMVTAMFLTKHLLIDWRLGETYFMQKLIDGDFAANNGGWQWSASTGTDSVPYFRIFNPFSQSKRFDPDGKFIKKFCPELRDVPAAALHNPQKLATAARTLDYPAFVVDHKRARERALAAFKSLKVI